MSFESNTGLGVNNNYGARAVGGAQGVIGTEGIKNEAAINFDGDALGFNVVLPAGAVVTNIIEEYSTGAVTAATVGLVDVIAAVGTEATYVACPLGGKVTLTGPTAGTVHVLYLNAL